MPEIIRRTSFWRLLQKEQRKSAFISASL
jgi:hypothetical protein